MSATQKPIEEVARFLIGARARAEPEAAASAGSGAAASDDGVPCTIIDAGHRRQRDLALELPPSPLEAVMSGEVWTQVYDRLADLIREHRTTLVFVNTRRIAERLTRHISERVGEENVATHHGSLSRERRLEAEQRLKRGELRALIATASLELGIDIGEVDLVCQVGSTRSINAFLQRVGRAGHSVGGTSKGRLFPLSRDELVECTAMLDAVRRGELDRLQVPRNSLDVLTQQIAAEVSSQEWSADALFELVRRAWGYRDLAREEFDECVAMLAEGFSTRRGRRGALIHHDAVHGMLRARRGGRLTAITSGGAIPDNADYKVMLEPEAQLVGTVNEDFAVESLQGDVFQLGNTSYRILRVERGTVRVEDAHGEAPSIPFWLGEAPARSEELSRAVSGLREAIGMRLDENSGAALEWLVESVALGPDAAAQLVEYLAAGRAALGALPTLETIVFERFFDESGGMQLVIHSPYGSRVNRAWGLALRKRFCRTFNFELQAAATEDHIVLSLTQAHSFELADVARYLHSSSARALLVQALLAAPMFEVRWRWDAGISLALPRYRGGKKIPAQIARMNAEDLLASVFPDQVACAENLPGEIEIPDHPLVRQTIRDCLEEAMDIEAFESLLRGLERGLVRVVARDLTEPSPLALEALNARPYAYLDDAPLEERRTQAVMSRRWIDPKAAADLGKLDAQAIARVRDEAWPDATTADELHDALSWLIFMTAEEVHATPAWPALMEELSASGRAAAVVSRGGRTLWVASERRTLLERDPIADESLREIVRGRLEGLGPVTAQALADPLGLPVARIHTALAALVGEGFAMAGRFTPAAFEDEWCDRRLLARIHRYTVKRLRSEIEPVPARDYLRFLFEWQRVYPEARMQGSDAVAAVLAQLEGFEAPASSWETDLLPSRITEYEPEWLDEHCRSGRFLWTRLAARAVERDRAPSPVRSTPITLLARRSIKAWSAFAEAHDPQRLSSRGRAVMEFLERRGASFFDEIADSVSMLPTEVEGALAELVALGLVNSDSFGGLRALLVPSAQRPSRTARRRPLSLFGMADAGRWALVRLAPSVRPDEEAVEEVVRTLLKRWGVIFWKLLGREAAWLPPWREILRCCRRLEARGEIRGGRFVAGFSGEQYAAAEAVGPLREARRAPHAGRYVSLSGADPLNLLGIVTPGVRLPSLAGNRLLYLDGVPIATFAAGEVRFLEKLGPKEEWEARNALLRRHVPAALAALDEA
ncbi:MAG TPA: helicase-related protein [Steroidobacteraceae bacterium]|nr:helicase-related protein [Steroidobacteraceae bacterium]